MSAAPVEAARWHDLTVRFGDRVALAHVDLAVHAGEFVALAGPNGSGKTTLLRTLLGFVPPDEGSVRLLGTPVGELSIRERARRTAWMPQAESPRDDVPVREYVRYGRYAHASRWESERPDDRRAASEMLASVGLADRGDDGVLSLSGGERQRAILARALFQEAPVLLLDEPTSHLDIGHQLDLLARVRAVAASGRATVIAALHDLNLAARYADRIVVLARGRKVADGPPSDVISTELLERVWGVAAELRRDPRSGTPYLLPVRTLEVAKAVPDLLGRGPVHVVGGGGAAAPVLRTLVDAGFRVTAGVLNLLDSDEEVARTLGIPCAVEGPFVPIGAEALARQRAFLAVARAVVVAPFPVGPSNLANLAELRSIVGRVPVLLLSRPAGVRWDFADGAAAAVEADLKVGGARVVAELSDLVGALAAAVAPAPAA